MILKKLTKLNSSYFISSLTMGNSFSCSCCGYTGGVKLSSRDLDRIFEIVDNVNYLSCPCKFTVINWENGKRKLTVFNVNGGLTEESQSYYMTVQHWINKIRKFFCRPLNDLTEMGEIYFQTIYPRINEHISEMFHTSAQNILLGKCFSKFDNRTPCVLLNRNVEGYTYLSKNQKNQMISISKFSKQIGKIGKTTKIMSSVDDIKKVPGYHDLISMIDEEKVCTWIDSILKLGYLQTDTVMEDKDKQKYAKKWTKLQKRQQSIYFKIYLPRIFVPCSLVRIDDTDYGFMIEWDDSNGERQVMEYIPHDKHDE